MENPQRLRDDDKRRHKKHACFRRRRWIGERGTRQALGRGCLAYSAIAQLYLSTRLSVFVLYTYHNSGATSAITSRSIIRIDTQCLYLQQPLISPNVITYDRWIGLCEYDSVCGSRQQCSYTMAIRIRVLSITCRSMSRVGVAERKEQIIHKDEIKTYALQDHL